MKRAILLLLAACMLLQCALFVACGSDKKDPAQDSEKDSSSQDDPNNPENPDVPKAPPITEQTVPEIYITTKDGAEIPLNKDTVDCTVSLDSSVEHYRAKDLTATIRCRGNGSMTVGKKTGKYPYKLKFDEKINLFGTGDGEAKEWVLIANVGDQSMLRNYAAKLLGDKLDGIPYSPNVRLVKVHLNDEYIGVYELTEQVEVKDYRVPVDDSYTMEENGFLVELDAYADGDYVYVGGYRFAVKSDLHSEEQLDFIQNYLDEVYYNICIGDMKALGKTVNMKSVVDMYLLQEFAKNIDIGWSSFYMYRDVDGKLFFAPPWDLDLAFGNDARLDNGSFTDLYVGTGRPGFMQNHEWFIMLYEYDWFKDLVKSRWKNVSHLFDEVIEDVRAMAEYITPAMDENYEKWDFLGKKQQQEPQAIVDLTTYKEHADYLVEWMTNRKAWLDQEFAK